jgi:VWFA-related protein
MQRTQAAFVVVLVCAVIAVGGAQTPQAPQPGRDLPVFRGSTSLVPVDVRVVDKDGNPVTDLTAAEFIVREDEVGQQIRHFSTQRLVPQPTGSDGSVTRRTGQAVALGPQSHRVILLMLGRGNLHGPVHGVDGMIAFVRDRLLPQDRVAVLSWNRATDFTTDHGRILALLERFKKDSLGIEMRLRHYMTGLAWLYGNRAIPDWLQRDIDAMFRGTEPGFVRSVHQAPIVEAGRIEDETRRALDLIQAPPSDTFSRRMAEADGLSFDEFVEATSRTMQDVSNLYAGVEYLRHIEGEKHLVWLQEYGISLPRTEDDRNLARVAADARVVLNIVRAGGVPTSGGSMASRPTRGLTVPNDLMPGMLRSTGGPGMSAGDGRWGMQTSRTLAEMTGGRFDANRFKTAAEAAAMIDRASRFQYLLGYYPTNDSWDGTFRNIKVEVTRPGLTVLYRRGYFARQDVLPFNRRALVSYSRIAASAGYADEIPDIRLDATATERRTGTARDVEIAVTVDLARVRFDREGDRYAGTIELAAFCLDRRGRPIGDVWQTFQLTATDAELDQLRREGMKIAMRVPVVAEADTVKLVIYDYGADLVGSRNLEVD